MLKLKMMPYALSVCKVETLTSQVFQSDFYFVGKTDEEISLVIKTQDVPNKVIEQEDGWSAFRIQGVLEFSLVDILAPILELLAKNNIGVFTVSTFNTDYILVKQENTSKTIELLASAGYEWV